MFIGHHATAFVAKRYDDPWTHSLLAVLGWSVAAAIVYRLFRAQGAGRGAQENAASGCRAGVSPAPACGGETPPRQPPRRRQSAEGRA